ncbi:protein YgfX [Undibacterium sp. Ji50W]|uniref:protein YgfX n=1 Tax=Undibacterium sp. Ji50W TaxID=3413041 RepID=UPI003BF19B6C
MSIALFAEIRPSRILLAALSGMAGLALASLSLVIWQSDMPVAAKALLWMIAAGLIVLQLYRGWRRERRFCRLSIADSGSMILRDHAGAGPDADLMVTLSPKSRLLPQLLSIFLIDEQGREHKLLILPDSVDPVVFRALKVSLMWISRHYVK